MLSNLLIYKNDIFSFQEGKLKVGVNPNLYLINTPKRNTKLPLFLFHKFLLIVDCFRRIEANHHESLSLTIYLHLKMIQQQIYQRKKECYFGVLLAPNHSEFTNSKLFCQRFYCEKRFSHNIVRSGDA